MPWQPRGDGEAMRGKTWTQIGVSEECTSRSIVRSGMESPKGAQGVRSPMERPRRSITQSVGPGSRS